MAIRNLLINNTPDPVDVFGPVMSLSGEEYAVTNMMFCNVSASDVTLDLWIVATGGGVDDSSRVIKELLIPASETFSFDTEKIILTPSDRIYAETKTASSGTQVDDAVGVTISYMRVS